MKLSEKIKKWNNIEGQDVGFYSSAFYNRYKVMYTDKVYHNYY